MDESVPTGAKMNFFFMRNIRNSKLSGGSIMVFGGISYEAHMDLAFDRGSATTQKYVDEVLQECGIPFASFIGDNALLNTLMRS